MRGCEYCLDSTLVIFGPCPSPFQVGVGVKDCTWAPPMLRTLSHRFGPEKQQGAEKPPSGTDAFFFGTSK